MRLGVAAVIAALFALAVPALASAELLFVTKTADTSDGTCGADCSLREAVDAATAADSVSVPAGTYLLTQGELNLTGTKTIVGAGARATVIDGGNFRVGSVAVGDPAGATTIGNVTITGGNGTGQSVGPGGAFLVNAGASLGLVNTTVVGNTALGQGGGIANAGSLVLQSTTVSGNQVTGASAPGLGGGIYAASGSSTSLANSTVSGNSAPGGGGGGVYSFGGMQLLEVTIAGNQAASGGGLFQNPQGAGASVLDTIVAGNAANDCGGNPGLFTGDHNIASDLSCGFTEVGDKEGVDPLLGPLANNGSETDTRALLAGSPAIDAGNPLFCGGSDQRGVVRPQGGGCDIGAYEFGGAPPEQPPPGPPPPPPPPRESDQLPPPVAGKTVNVLPSSGTVRIKLPGSDKFVVLEAGQQVPVGTVIDARKGRVTLVAAADKRGGTATAVFYDGIFKLGQTKGAKPITTLELVEKLSCGKRSGKASVARKKKKRQLWGDGKGRFRTEGDYSSATVRGTKWLTQDRCDSTLTRVVRGKVEVRDFVKRRTVVVRAGKQYLAKRNK